MSDEFQEFMDWRELERKKPRIMGIHEYRMWCVVGDSLGSPRTTYGFPGGLTIDFSGKNYSDDPRILGKTTT